MDSDMAERALRELDWLADLHKSQCFTTSEVSCPAKSSDFGADGYTASLTDWHELLQLTAPDGTCGLVFVRGQFPNTPDAILARAQRRDDSGNKGTLGTRLQPAEHNTDLELGERRVQGWINLKWPYSQYELKKKNRHQGWKWRYPRADLICPFWDRLPDPPILVGSWKLTQRLRLG